MRTLSEADINAIADAVVAKLNPAAVDEFVSTAEAAKRLPLWSTPKMVREAIARGEFKRRTEVQKRGGRWVVNVAAYNRRKSRERVA